MGCWPIFCRRKKRLAPHTALLFAVGLAGLGMQEPRQHFLNELARTGLAYPMVRRAAAATRGMSRLCRLADLLSDAMSPGRSAVVVLSDSRG